MLVAGRILGVTGTAAALCAAGCPAVAAVALLGGGCRGRCCRSESCSSGGSGSSSLCRSNGAVICVAAATAAAAAAGWPEHARACLVHKAAFGLSRLRLGLIALLLLLLLLLLLWLLELLLLVLLLLLMDAGVAVAPWLSSFGGISRLAGCLVGSGCSRYGSLACSAGLTSGCHSCGGSAGRAAACGGT